MSISLNILRNDGIRSAIEIWLSIRHLEEDLTRLNTGKQSKQLNEFFLATEFKKLCQPTKDYGIWWIGLKMQTTSYRSH